MTNIYVIDTSSLIRLNKENPLDVFPSVWKRLEALVKSDRLIAPREVLDEIVRRDDQLKAWAKTQKRMFKEPTSSQTKLVKDILSKYPSIVKVDELYSADPWVIALTIALTLEMANNPQQTLMTIKRIVVTEERLRGNQITIPFVCKQYSIDAIDIVEMFRTEGWKF